MKPYLKNSKISETSKTSHVSDNLCQPAVKLQQKFKLQTVTHFSAAVMLGLLSTWAWASGQHAGGHHADATAIGQAGDSKKVTRTVHIEMTDNMRFIPVQIKVQQGETILFKVKNSGKIKHEMVLGTEKDLKAHYEVMKKFPEMEHEDPNMVTVKGGETAQMIWHFTRSGKVDFACLQPGHYDAGMKGAVAVSPLAAKSKKSSTTSTFTSSSTPSTKAAHHDHSSHQ